MKNPHTGTSHENRLREEGIFDEVKDHAIKTLRKFKSGDAFTEAYFTEPLEDIDDYPVEVFDAYYPGY